MNNDRSNDEGRPPQRGALPPRAPMPQQPAPQARALHPAAAEAAATYSQMCEDLDRAVNEANALRTDNEVLRRQCAELARSVDYERSQKERYLRYSVKVKQRLGDIADDVAKANAEAIDAAISGDAESATGDDADDSAPDQETTETEAGALGAVAAALEPKQP
jgi:hypothetical protein